MRPPSSPPGWSRPRWRRLERRLTKHHPPGRHRRQRWQQRTWHAISVAISHRRVHGAVRGGAKRSLHPAPLAVGERHVRWEVSALSLGATQSPQQRGSVRPVGRARRWRWGWRRRQESLRGRAHFTVRCGCPRRCTRFAMPPSVMMQRPPIHGPFGRTVAGSDTASESIRRWSRQGRQRGRRRETTTGRGQWRLTTTDTSPPGTRATRLPVTAAPTGAATTANRVNQR